MKIEKLWHGPLFNSVAILFVIQANPAHLLDVDEPEPGTSNFPVSISSDCDSEVIVSCTFKVWSEMNMHEMKAITVLPINDN